MLVIRERTAGSLARLAISNAKREVKKTCLSTNFPLEAVAEDAIERIAIVYLQDAIKLVEKRKPRL
jgi:hypothetical protein